MLLSDITLEYTV